MTATRTGSGIGSATLIAPSARAIGSAGIRQMFGIEIFILFKSGPATNAKGEPLQRKTIRTEGVSIPDLK
jgi:hypothetical protein